MSKAILTACGAALAFALGGCVNMAPKLPAAQPAIPAAWPLPADSAGQGNAAEIGWRQFYTDARLVQLIELALQNNRDLRVAVLNVEKARALYRVQRADRLP